HFIGLADHIRDTLPDAGISTDIIVGFPGESNEEFEETLEVMERVKFDSAFTFKYSSRPGTKAAEFSDHISEEEKKERLQRVIELQKKHTLERNLESIGKIEIVLVEKESKKSSAYWAGRTDSNKWVIIEKGNTKIKDFVPALITAAKGVTLHGDLVTQEEAHAV
ncbi:MAG TPA: TRAM domain-containing protein, partial [Candidatus Marinimicrobia bacterium]|nr:TRAM domain-containing protein [Candidatus Neomarinimicrobiota bacterium]